MILKLKDRIKYKTVAGIKEGRIEDIKEYKVFIATGKGGKWINKSNIIKIIK